MNEQEAMAMFHNMLGGDSEEQTTIRLGMFHQHMTEWLTRHPDANEQQEAATVRFAAYIRNPTGWRAFFKSYRQLGVLLGRTDTGHDI